jgi:hypothetical protein
MKSSARLVRLAAHAPANTKPSTLAPSRPVLQPELLKNQTLAHGPMELVSPVICTAPKDAGSPTRKNK